MGSTYSSLVRFRELQKQEPSIDPSVTPLSIYLCEDTNRVKLITAKDIESFMRRLASPAHDLNPIEDAAQLKRWSSHSLRVGAVVVPHAMGFAPLDIQWLLRWKSTAFMAYSRNLSILSSRQNRALDRAAGMPHYI